MMTRNSTAKRAKISKADGRERRDRCKAYIRQHGSVPAAMKAAARVGFVCATSAWTGAMSEILGELARKDAS